jgi:hypothetical protein
MLPSPEAVQPWMRPNFTPPRGSGHCGGLDPFPSLDWRRSSCRHWWRRCARLLDLRRRSGNTAGDLVLVTMDRREGGRGGEGGSGEWQVGRGRGGDKEVACAVGLQVRGVRQRRRGRRGSGGCPGSEGRERRSKRRGRTASVPGEISSMLVLRHH